MSNAVATLMAGAAFLLANADEPAKPANAESKAPVAAFKIIMEYYDLQTLVASGEFVVDRGRVYQFMAGSNEVTVLDRERNHVRLLDLGRQLQAVVNLADIDQAMTAYRKDIQEAQSQKETSTARADRIEAAMLRDLLNPQFKVAAADASGRLKLSNSSVQVEALSESEPDARRLAIINDAIVVNTRLRTVRQSGTSHPPYAMFETVAAIIAKKQRPTELTFVFRLAGPPKKYRWVFEFVPTTTDREQTAINQINNLFGKTKMATFERYERQIGTRKPAPKS